MAARIRLRAVVPAALAVAALGAGLLLWRDRGLWRESAAHAVREALARDFGAEFQYGRMRVRAFPPLVSLGQVTFHRRGEPWVLTAEEADVSLNLYAVLAGRERLGKVTLTRPRLFAWPSPARAAPPAAGAPAEREPPQAEAPSRPVRLPRISLPFRALEVREGEIEARDRAGRRLSLRGVGLVALASPRRIEGKFTVGKGALRLPAGELDLGEMRADLLLEGGRVTVRRFSSSSPALRTRLRGTVEADAGAELDAEVRARLQAVLPLTGKAYPAAGTLSFKGRVSGPLGAPEAAGTLAVEDLAWRGGRPLDLAGKVSWRQRRLAWEELSGALAGGTLRSTGWLDLSGHTPRHGVEVALRGIAVRALPVPVPPAAAKVEALEGALSWEGEGLRAEELAGLGTAKVRFAVRDWPSGPVDLEARAAVSGPTVRLESLSAAVQDAALSASGVWRRPEGLRARVSARVPRLGPLLALAGDPVDGEVEAAGEVRAGREGVGFSGEVRASGLRAAGLSGIAASAQVEAGPQGVEVRGGELRAAGGRVLLEGRLALPSGALAFESAWESLSAQELARLIGARAGAVEGRLAGQVAVRGRWQEPVLAGEVSAEGLGAAGVGWDRGRMGFTFTKRRLEVEELVLSRGGTQFSFHGELLDGSALRGTFECPAFSLADFLPDTAADVAGSLSGELGGRLDSPVLTGTLQAERLRHGWVDFKGARLDWEFREGALSLEGTLTEEANRFRATLRAAGDWPFEAELTLGHFSPEMARSGFEALPPALGRALGKAAFLAAGSLRAHGSLRDPRAVEAELRLESLWFEAAGRTLQNTAPVRIAWRGQELSVEEFSLAGDRYRVRLQGTGGPRTGWNLAADGEVNLALFKEYWEELQAVDAVGEVHLTLGGPWGSPVPRGRILLKGGGVQLRALPEPLRDLSGEITLRERTLVLSQLGGTIGSGSFRAEGTYRFDEAAVDLQVDGTLDLSLFRTRVKVARELRGPVAVHLRLRGPIRSPSFVGEAELRGAEFFVKPFPVKLTKVHGTVVLEERRLEVRELRGQLGGGSLGLGGVLSWDVEPPRADFDLSGREIILSLEGTAKAVVDLDLGLHGAFPDLTLAGEVRLLKGRYTREFGEKIPVLVRREPKGEGAPEGEERPEEKGRPALPDLSRTALDVRLRAPDGVWIANKTAQIETGVALELGGTLGEPTLRGEISGIRGEAYYLTRQFRLESGKLRFERGIPQPRLEVQASTKVGEVQILLLIDGPLGMLTYHLVSVPPMSEDDLAVLLTVGKTRASLEERGEKGTAVGAAVFSSGMLVSSIGNEARNTVGLEVLQVEPLLEEGRVSARVTLGTHLSDRLFVSYSQNLGATEDQQVKVEYYLLDYLSFLGQELRQGVYSLDLVFKYAFP